MIHVLYDKPVADKKTLAVIYRVKVGLERRPAAEAAGREALARWETTLAAGEVSEGLRKEERAAVSKLEVLLKVIRVFVFATGVPFFFLRFILGEACFACSQYNSRGWRDAYCCLL